MDPTATFQEILENFNRADIDELVTNCDNLHKWICDGGALPSQKVGHGLTKEGYLVLLTSVIGYFGDPDRKPCPKCGT